MKEPVINVGWFEGSHYWEVMIDGEQVFTTQNRYEAFMFAAQLILKLKGKL